MYFDATENVFIIKDVSFWPKTCGELFMEDFERQTLPKGEEQSYFNDQELKEWSLFLIKIINNTCMVLGDASVHSRKG